MRPVLDKPATTDGRDIDPELGSLLGEASHQISRREYAGASTVPAGLAD